MNELAEERQRLWDRYGRARRIRPDIPDEVLVFAHESREAAEGYADADREFYGHPARAELREGVGWVCVVDLRPAIARIEAEMDR